MAEIEESRDKRLFVADTFRQYETRCAHYDFEKEKTLAETEFEVSQAYTLLWSCIMLMMYMYMYVYMWSCIMLLCVCLVCVGEEAGAEGMSSA